LTERKTKQSKTYLVIG